MLEESKKKLVNWLVASLILTIILIAVLLIELIPSNLNRYIVFKALSDGFFAGSSTVVFVALLRLVGRSGFFDTAAFGFVVLGENLKRNATHKYKDAYDYKTQRQERRNINKPFLWPYWIVGGIGLAIAVAFMFLSISTLSK